MQDLNSEQLQAVDYNEGHLLIVAGPGTGKTHTITTKIAVLMKEKGVSPANIVAITFTRKAGKQLEERLKKLLPVGTLLPFCGTFHSFCLNILQTQQRHPLQIISEKQQQEILKEITQIIEPGENGQRLKNVQTRLSLWKNAGETGADAQNLQIFQRYQVKLNQLGVLDFDDIIAKTFLLIKNDLHLQQKVHEKIRYLFVDEYQDVNDLQYRLIQALTGSHARLCAIGDPDQAIYGFRGANSEHFLRFEKDFPGSKVLYLEKNYRSTPNIVDAANALIANNTERVHKNLRSQADQGPKIILQPCETVFREAEFVALQINKLVGGTDMNDMDQKTGEEYDRHYHFTDIAVIYRTNSQGRTLATSMKKSGLPFQRLADRIWFLQEEIIKYADYLGALHHTDQELEGLTPSQILRKFLGNIHGGDETAPNDEKNHENFMRLQNFFMQFDEETGVKGLQKAVNEFKLLKESDAYDERFQAVTLMSIHAAKGLEFPVVFVIGLEEGNLPYYPKVPGNVISSAGQQPGLVSKDAPAWAGLQLEEQRRLMYVAITRAKERLFITYAKTKQKKPTTPSIFLEEIAEHTSKLEPQKRNPRTVWKKKQMSLL